MTYQYLCSQCKANLEHIQPMSVVLPKNLACPYCKGEAHQVIQASNIARSGESNAPLDVIIGHSADVRWAQIHERQALRDKVRSTAGQIGLTATGKSEYNPITAEQKKLRTTTNQQIQKRGYNPVYGVLDAKLVR